MVLSIKNLKTLGQTDPITMDVYGDNANIIPEEIPELLTYMDEVMPDKSDRADTNSNAQDIMLNIDEYLPKKNGTE